MFAVGAGILSGANGDGFDSAERCGSMQLRLIARGEVVETAAAGAAQAGEFKAGQDPFTSLLGADAFTLRVAVDAAGLKTLDSAGIGLLVTCRKRFAQQGGRLVLHSLPPLVRQTLEVMKLDQVLDLARDREAALVRLAAAT